MTTKEKIIQAAQQLFMQIGFNGVSIADIAQQAEVNKSLIFHHFGTKEALWVAAKHDIVIKANKESKILPDSNYSFDEFLTKLFEQSLSFYKKNPQIVRMINWQRLDNDLSSDIGIVRSPELTAWLNAFTVYQQKGDIAQQLNLEFVMTMVLSLISSLALDPNVFIKTPQEQQKYIAFCVVLLKKGLQ